MEEETPDETEMLDEDIHSEIVSGSTIIFAGKILGLVLGFLARSLPARLLGPDKYGSLTLGWTVVSIVSFVSLLGLRDGVTRYIPKYNTQQDKKSILVTAISSALPWSILLMATIVFFAGEISSIVFSDNVSPEIIVIFSLLIPVITINKLLLSYFRGLKNARINVIVKNVLNAGLRMILVPGAILAGFSVYGAAVGWVLALTLTLVFSVYFLYRETPIFHVERNSTHFSKLLGFSLPLMLAGSMGIVLGSADNLLIGIYLDSSAVGIYDPAFILSSLITTGLTVFSYMFLPVFTELHDNEKHNEMNDLYNLVTKWIFTITFPVYLIFVAHPGAVLEVFFGSAYISAAPALVILATGSLVNASVGLCVQGLVATGSTRFIMYVNIGAAIINILLNIILIPQLGIIGAALASALTTIGYNLLYAYRIHQESGISPIPRKVILPSLLPTIAVLAIGRPFPDVIPSVGFLFLLGIIVTLLYLIGYIFFGATDEEDIDLVEILEKQTSLSLTPVKRLLRMGLEQ